MVDNPLLQALLGLAAVAATFLAVILGCALLTMTPLRAPRRRLVGNERRDADERDT